MDKHYLNAARAAAELECKFLQVFENRVRLSGLSYPESEYMRMLSRDLGVLNNELILFIDRQLKS